MGTEVTLRKRASPPLTPPHLLRRVFTKFKIDCNMELKSIYDQSYIKTLVNTKKKSPSMLINIDSLT